MTVCNRDDACTGDPAAVTTCGLQIRCPDSVTAENKADTDSGDPVWASDLEKLFEQHPELTNLIAAWPTLPEPIRRAIAAMIMASEK